MSDDLISRKMVLEILEKVFCEYRMSWSIDGKNNGFASAVPQAIKEAPTAYDVDAVCKNLDKASDYYETDEQGKEHVQMVNLIDAIEIVRNGGRNDI